MRTMQWHPDAGDELSNPVLNPQSLVWPIFWSSLHKESILLIHGSQYGGYMFMIVFGWLHTFHRQSERLQRWITCFANDINGNPNCARKANEKDFLPMSDGAMWIGFGLPITKDNKVIPDETYAMSKLTGDLPGADVCDFWSSAPYYEADPDVTRALTYQKGRVTELQTVWS